MEKNKLKKSIYYLVIVILFFVLLYNLKIIFLNRTNDNEIVDESSIELISSNDEEKINELDSINGDIRGIIKIPGTSINEKIFQSIDNDYYLSHKEDGSYSKYGSITLDYRNNLNDKNIIIYGHNSSWYGTEIVPFKELENYRSNDYFNSHKYIDIVTKNNINKYEIFSVQDTTDYSYMNMNYNSIDDWIEHLNNLKSKSLYDTKVNVEPNDSILILQTCSFKEKNSFLLVIARKVEK